MLFVTGMSAKSTTAIKNLNQICETYLNNSFELQIIDINSEPLLAIEHQIIAIPTLINYDDSEHKTMIIGDLSDTDKVLKILDII